MSQFAMHDPSIHNAFASDSTASRILGFVNRWNAGIQTGMRTGGDMLSQIAFNERADLHRAYTQCLARGGDDNYCRMLYEQAAGRQLPQQSMPAVTRTPPLTSYSLWDSYLGK